MSIEYLDSEHIEFRNGKSVNRVELAFSFFSELETLENIAPASIGWHKRTGDFYSFDGGQWWLISKDSPAPPPPSPPVPPPPAEDEKEEEGTSPFILRDSVGEPLTYWEIHGNTVELGVGRSSGLASIPISFINIDNYEEITSTINLPSALMRGDTLDSFGTLRRADGTIVHVSVPPIQTLPGDCVMYIDTYVQPEYMKVRYRTI